ncbi:hypothetical protein A2291_07160 [candidate division WOR-1 bacterium RIFOXYB2_FULL_42_35]|uniref:Flagellar basal body rod protein FlgB n=1 Tax=candidate division WOR-1 bacterium RIFOXYC2_FULL_41_25 TaxID=1802586 RepID=A0A1F4TKG9_UNCSA|nr:MAG: hypothetical protein A2247_04500 [candidate division WOR-1 bacterium RIFOXYA2_FULL_41_14]OGC22484.1 MAG: hypothetical protein A2291_07160 [candidate division WOR-1 bacterium RIFOXYB2_FULL_42_35]OGC33222.1 MAG: hypothetical protein A2462_07335 [candidate division WOR-1 bacterium RIFOXYC2_FULL_41_25]OGC43492.1 MAG: hypothetical protein A2548_00890 [candidate division WOR-1 bacterium RIFOXYD2_FULL_41_8]
MPNYTPVELFDGSFDKLEKAMAIVTKRQEIISNNIANANTPGFKPLEFNEELMKAVERVDRSKVVLEDEMAALTENSVKYSSYVKLLSSRISILKTIASQGKR